MALSLQNPEGNPYISCREQFTEQEQCYNFSKHTQRNRQTVVTRVDSFIRTSDVKHIRNEFMNNKHHFFFNSGTYDSTMNIFCMNTTRHGIIDDSNLNRNEWKIFSLFWIRNLICRYAFDGMQIMWQQFRMNDAECTFDGGEIAKMQTNCFVLENIVWFVIDLVTFWGKERIFQINWPKFEYWKSWRVQIIRICLHCPITHRPINHLLFGRVISAIEDFDSKLTQFEPGRSIDNGRKLAIFCKTINYSLHKSNRMKTISIEIGLMID